MELRHSFTVPVPPEQAWAAFEDIASVAECFPGAAVTSVTEDRFQGTCKVKLGPVAMQYAGSGSFVERDHATGRMALTATGRDKRGNGTAGADITATLTAEGASSTRVEVVTDLQITGRPAQFGRGMIQDVSDKLLGQFVACLEQKVAVPDQVTEAVPTSNGDEEAPVGLTPARPPGQDHLDLGTTVLPVLLRSYGPPIGFALLALLLMRWLRGRLRPARR